MKIVPLQLPLFISIENLPFHRLVVKGWGWESHMVVVDQAFQGAFKVLFLA
jgi:hypothetical protein